jgi:hypothetical protein
MAYLKQFLLLIFLMLNLSACPGHGKGSYAVSYSGGILTDENGHVHIAFSDTYDWKVVYMEKVDGRWHREVVASVSHRNGIYVEHIQFERERLCIYTSRADQSREKYCKGSGGWDVAPRKQTPLVDYNSGDYGYDIWLGDGSIFYVKETPNSSVYELYLIDQETGVFTPYNPPSIDKKLLQEKGYEVLGIVKSNTSTQQYRYPARLSGVLAPFFEEGRWNGRSFIGKAIYQPETDDLYNVKTPTALFHVEPINGQWNIEPFYQEDNELTIYSRLMWANKRVVIMGRDPSSTHRITKPHALIKKNSATGKLFLEELSSFYKFALERKSLTGAIHMDAKSVDAVGKVHLLVQEFDGQPKHRNFYYEVYNPNSPTPETPEIRERIE